MKEFANRDHQANAVRYLSNKRYIFELGRKKTDFIKSRYFYVTGEKPLSPQTIKAVRKVVTGFYFILQDGGKKSLTIKEIASASTMKTTYRVGGKNGFISILIKNGFLGCEVDPTDKRKRIYWLCPSNCYTPLFMQIYRGYMPIR